MLGSKKPKPTTHDPSLAGRPAAATHARTCVVDPTLPRFFPFHKMGNPKGYTLGTKESINILFNILVFFLCGIN